MRRSSAPIAALAAAAGLALAQAPPAARLAYRFDEVKSKVVRLPGGDERGATRVAAGDPAEAGDVVRTGAFARAVLSVPERAARFELSSSSRVRLAGPEPGVVLVLESGRLKAVFDAFTGASEERRVAAPGALLAVRGTRYGLETTSDGGSVLAVFEGTVEVFPVDGSPSLRVERGEFCRLSREGAPRKGAMDRAGMSEKGWGSRGSGFGAGGAGVPGSSGAQGPSDAGPQGRRTAGSGGRGGH